MVSEKQMQLSFTFTEQGRLGRYPMQQNRDFFKSNVVCYSADKSMPVATDQMSEAT
jgi:hypothetical protein